MASEDLKLENVDLTFGREKLGLALQEHRKAVSIIVGLVILYRLLFVYSRDNREPVLIKPRFPLIGHAINIYRLGSRHFVGVA